MRLSDKVGAGEAGGVDNSQDRVAWKSKPVKYYFMVLGPEIGD